MINEIKRNELVVIIVKDKDEYYKDFGDDFIRD